MSKELNMDPQYIENLSPADRNIYINYYKEEKLKEQQKESSGGNIPMGINYPKGEQV